MLTLKIRNRKTSVIPLIRSIIIRGKFYENILRLRATCSIITIKNSRLWETVANVIVKIIDSEW